MQPLLKESCQAREIYKLTNTQNLCKIMGTRTISPVIPPVKIADVKIADEEINNVEIANVEINNVEIADVKIANVKIADVEITAVKHPN